MIQVTTIDHLRELLKNIEYGEFFILLNGGVRSSKTISHKGNIFHVTNEIDDSTQDLTVEEMFDEGLTFIGKAMKAGAFYMY